jgi:transcriptional regulator with XRE-family HTH domain
MKAKGLSVHELANATDVGYESMRGTVTGDRPPSKLRLREICRVLGLDFESIHEMWITEQMNRKFGRVSAGRKNDSELQSIEEAWPLLLPEEKEHIGLLVGKYVERKQRQRLAPPAPKIVPRPVR